ncbi:MAG TPA: response regulator transcription factor [Candidatus Paceibacterota bacterium]|nr:response regulator transcription factor [Candidatus Paceibacterota bacterium]
MRILVVEDQEETAATLKRKLEAECYAVDVEHDGEKGFYKARTNDYDLILLDKTLPGKDGYEICSALREYNMAAPILILSAAAEIEDKVQLLNCGADDYLTKPYVWSELAARVKALLRRPQNIHAKALVVEDLSLDAKTYSFTFRERTTRLTPKEFMLLEYLMRNAGTVVSRGMILEHVWDDSADQFSKSIDMHVMNLRRKIDRRDKDAFIHTVPGRGFIVGKAYVSGPRST